MAPVTLRRGDIVLHINDLEALPSVLKSMDETSMQVPSAGLSSIAEHVRKAASTVQQDVSDLLQLHCTSMRDAIYLLRKRGMLSRQLLKKLTNLNLADSFIRHGTRQSLEALALEVRLAVQSDVDSLACGKSLAAGGEK